MGISEAKVSSKFQVTIPAWVREELCITANCEIVWIGIKPGDISLVSKGPSNEDPIDKLCGILKGKGHDKIDLVKSFLEDRKKDRILAERGFLKD